MPAPPVAETARFSPFAPPAVLVLIFLGLSLPLPAKSSAPDSAADRWLASVATPEFSAPAAWPAWEKQRTEIRATLWRLLGDFPPRPPPDRVKTLWRRSADGYTLEKFQFDDGIGATVPGYLFLPAHRSGPLPAILYCHWHGGQWPVGKEEMLQTNATPVPPGPTLARRGYAVLGIDAPGFGERNGQGPGGLQEKNADGEMTAAKFNLWAGRSLWGMTIRDDLMALDYLASRPEVDRSRLGVTGISMGSTRAWWLMALDDRLRTGVSVACFTRYRDLIENEDLKIHGIYYFVPGMLRHFDSEAVIACIAPRPMLFLTGDRDPGSPLSGIRTLESKVASVYRLAGQDGHFQSVIYPDTGHIYLPAMWERMTAWMDQNLQGRAARPGPPVGATR